MAKTFQFDYPTPELVKEYVDKLRQRIIKGIDISGYQIIYLQPNEYHLR